MKVTDIIIPVESPWTLKRFGPRHDCGYVVAVTPEFLKLKALYGYGVGTNVQFESEVIAETGAKGYLFDHTVDALYENNVIFKPQKGTAESILRHLHENDHYNRYLPMLLKMDIEGDEWDIFDHALPALLNFHQICVEVHHLTVKPLEEMLRILNKLFSYYHLVHLHANNYGTVKDGVPNTLEFTLVERSVFDCVPVQQRKPLPFIGLDYPNNTKLPDITLDWWLPKQVEQCYAHPPCCN